MSRDDVAHVQRLGGWCCPIKAYHLYDLVTELAGRVPTVNAVELGVFEGKSLLCAAMALRDANNNGNVTGIDPYTPNANSEGFDLADLNQRRHVDWWRGVDYHAVATGARHAIVAHGCAPWAKLRVAMPDAVAHEYDGLHFLHIDDSHSEATSCRNAMAWMPKLVPGGLLVLDDAHWPTVQSARQLIAARMQRIDEKVSDGMQWEVYAQP